jgi:hypothetical protein
MLLICRYRLVPCHQHITSRLWQKDWWRSRRCPSMYRSPFAHTVVLSPAKLFRYCQYRISANTYGNGCIPAGSLRCERLVRSSLASSMAGFMSGGREEVDGSSCSTESVVSITFVCKFLKGQRTRCRNSLAGGDGKNVDSSTHCPNEAIAMMELKVMAKYGKDGVRSRCNGIGLAGPGERLHRRSPV